MAQKRPRCSRAEMKNKMTSFETTINYGICFVLMTLSGWERNVTCANYFINVGLWLFYVLIKLKKIIDVRVFLRNPLFALPATRNEIVIFIPQIARYLVFLVVLFMLAVDERNAQIVYLWFHYFQPSAGHKGFIIAN